MAESQGGIKISNLTNATSIDGSYNVIVDNGTTYKTTLNSIRNFFNQSAQNVDQRLNSIEANVRNNSTSITNIGEDLTTIRRSISEAKDEAIETSNQYTDDAITIISSAISSAIEGETSTSSSKIDTISTDVDELKTGIDTINADIDNINERIDSISFSDDTNLISSEDNPIVVNSILDSYHWYDRYCFGNTDIDADGLSAVDGELLSVYEEDGETLLCAMPGLQTFEIGGIPIRAGMLSAGAPLNIGVGKRSNVSLYLTKSMFYTDADTILSVRIGNRLISKKVLESNNDGSDTDLELVWTGILDESYNIEYSVSDSGTDISTYSLIGAIVPYTI